MLAHPVPVKCWWYVVAVLWAAVYLACSDPRRTCRLCRCVVSAASRVFVFAAASVCLVLVVSAVIGAAVALGLGYSHVGAPAP